MKKLKPIHKILIILESLIVLGTCILIIPLLSEIGKPIQIRGNSMNPTLQDGEMYFIKQSSGYKQLDIIVYQVRERLQVGRIMGFPGETINFENGEIYIDNAKISLYSLPRNNQTFPGTIPVPYIVPQNSYFIIGDNRLHSLDSRYFGAVEERSIVGELGICYWNCK